MAPQTLAASAGYLASVGSRTLPKTRELENIFRRNAPLGETCIAGPDPLLYLVGPALPYRSCTVLLGWQRALAESESLPMTFQFRHLVSEFPVNSSDACVRCGQDFLGPGRDRLCLRS